MAFHDVIARIGMLESALDPKPIPRSPAIAAESFQSALKGALGSSSVNAAANGVPLPANIAADGQSGGAKALQFAASQVGVSEQPPGSNDGQEIAEYRASTAGSGVGPWCAYFVSWAAQQAGTPLGEAGQGFGSVAAVTAWAERTGRALPAGATPQPGDLIVWGSQHIGIVESIGTDGAINTIEGNSSDSVTRRVHGPDGDGATGYVRL